MIEKLREEVESEIYPFSHKGFGVERAIAKAINLTIKKDREAILKAVEVIIPKAFGCNKDIQRALCGEISFANKIVLCDDCTMKVIEKFEEIKQLLKGK